MKTPHPRFAHPLAGGGSEYALGAFVWAVCWSADRGWFITADSAFDPPDTPHHVVRGGFPTACAAEDALFANARRMYDGDGAPTR
jgi:hypothetical protein